MRTRSSRRFLSFVAAAAASAVAGSALAQVKPVTQIAAVGQNTGQANVFYSSFVTSPPISISDTGQVYFTATLSGSGVFSTSAPNDNQGLYVGTGASTTLVARRVDPVPGFTLGDAFYGATSSTAISQFISTSSPTIDDLGNVVYKATMFGAGIGGTGDDTAIFMGTPGSPQLIVQEGKAAPASALTGDMVLGDLLGDVNFNLEINNGKMLFLAPVTGKGTALMTATGPGTVATVAYASTTAGTMIGADMLTSLSTGRKTINSAGEIFFQGSLNGSSSQDVLVRGNSTASLTIVAREGTATPIAGVNYGTTFSINDRVLAGNNIAFQSNLAGAVTTKTDTAIFIDSGSGLQALVREDDLIPNQPDAADLPTGAVTLHFDNLANLKLTSTGYAVFSAQGRGDNQTAGTTSYDGIFTGQVVAGTPVVKKVALEKDTKGFSQSALHFERGQFSWGLNFWNGINLAATGINANGDIIFYSGASTTGSLLTEVEGFMMYEASSGRVFPLLYEGDQISIDTGSGPVTRTLTSVANNSDANGGDGDGRKSFFNDQRQLVVQANYTGGSAIVVIDADDYIPVSFHTWNSTGGANWSAGPWINGAPNAQKTYAEFSDAITAPATITLDTPVTVGEVFFDNANKVTLSGVNALTLEGVSDRGYIGAAKGSHEISAPLALADTTSIVLDGAKGAQPATALLISGDIGGAGALRKGGPGRLTLSGSNTHLGGTILLAGVTEISSNANLGDSAAQLVFSGGVLEVNTAITIPRGIFVDDVNVSGGGIYNNIPGAMNVTAPVNLSGTLSYLGDRRFMKAGSATLTLSGNGGLGGLQLREGTVDITGSYAFGGADITISSQATLNVLAGGTLNSTGLMNPLTGAFVNIHGSANVNSFATGTGSLTEQAVVNVTGSLSTVTTLLVNGSFTSVSSNNNTHVSVMTVESSGVVTVGTTTDVDGLLTVNGQLTTQSLIMRGVTRQDAPAGELTIGGTVNVLGNANLIGPSSLDNVDPPYGPTMIRLQSGGNFTVGGNLTVGDSGVFAKAQFNGAASVTGDILLDADQLSSGFNEELAISVGPTGSLSAGNITLNADTSTTASIAASALLDVDGQVNSTGALNLISRRTSSSSTANKMLSTVTADISGVADVGDVTLDGRERTVTAGVKLDTNLSTHTLNVAGTLLANKIVVLSQTETGSTSTPTLTRLANPDIGTYAVTITGLAKMKLNGLETNASFLPVVPSFGGTGQLDLTNNDLVVQVSTQALVEAAVTSGANSGAWDGSGIISSAALASGYNSSLGVATFGTLGLASYAGVAAEAGDVLVKYVSVGDLNMDGVVTLAEANAVQANLGLAGGWAQGAASYSGTVQLIDAAGAIANIGTLIDPPGPAVTAPIDVTPLVVEYDAITGKLVVTDFAGTGLLAENFVAMSASGQFIGANLLTPGGAQNPTGTAGVIGWLSYSNIFGDGFDLGAVLPAGLTFSQVSNDLSIYYSRDGQIGLFQAPLSYVPEPSSLVALAIGGLLALRRTRRRA